MMDEAITFCARMSRTLQVGDEEAFLTYEEKVVYDLQKAWSGKAGMEGVALMDTCAKLEDLIYNDALKEYNLSLTANVWSKRECIIYFQEKCDVLLRNLESKELNWKKLFDESRMNTRHVLQTIMKTDGDRKYKSSADAYKSASRALMPKARKSAIGGASITREPGVKKNKPGPKPTTGKRGRVSNAELALRASMSSAALGEYADSANYGSSNNFAAEGGGEVGVHDMGSFFPVDTGLVDEFGFDFEAEDGSFGHQGSQPSSIAVEDESAWMS